MFFKTLIQNDDHQIIRMLLQRSESYKFSRPTLTQTHK